MGAQVSKTSYEQINKSMLQTTNSVQIEIANKAVASGILNQQIIVNIIGSDCGDNLTIKNDAAATIVAVSETQNEFTQELANKLTETLQTEVAKQLNQSQEGLNFGQVQVNEDTAKIVNESKTIIENSIKVGIDQSSVSSQITNQGLQINMIGSKAKNCDFSNAAIQNVIAESIVGNVMKSITDNSKNKDILNKYNFKYDASQEGVSLLGTLFGGFPSFPGLPDDIGSIVTGIIVLIAIVIVVAIIAKLLFGGKKGKKGKKVKK